MPYLYETHLHTNPASRCSRASVRECLEFYKSQGYAGVFITNHFVDGNIGCDKSLPYEEMIEFYFADYEEGKELSKEIGIDVFFGIESSYKGTDFLVYGLDKAWYLSHPEIVNMKKTEMLSLMMDSGALIIQAHPYREAHYIDHIRLFPRHFHGVEVYNANRSEFQNGMAEHYSASYGLIRFSGSDNHVGNLQINLGGMAFDTPLRDEADFITRIMGGDFTPFSKLAGEEPRWI